jgi:hypothetical protein
MFNIWWIDYPLESFGQLVVFIYLIKLIKWFTVDVMWEEFAPPEWRGYTKLTKSRAVARPMPRKDS